MALRSNHLPSAIRHLPSSMPPIHQSCYWLSRLPPHSITPVHGRLEAEVVVIGAGLTGLWTALFLKELEPRLDVAVIEQETAAFGASGRNAGMLSETVDHSHPLAIQHFGRREAGRLARLGAANVDAMLAWLAARGIDCEYEATGRLIMAHTEAHLEEARVAVAVAESLGLSRFRLLSRDAAQAELHSPLYLGGVAVDAGGILNPALLVDGLRREAVRLGVRLYEQSPVTGIDRKGAGIVVRTRDGVVQGRRAVLATSAWSHRLLPQLARHFIPLYDYILVSEPLTAAQWDLIGWRNRQGVTDGRAFFNYYRPTADGRVLWGTSEAAYYPPNRIGPEHDHSASHYAALRDSWQRHFPALAQLAFPFQWGGAIDSTTRLTPFFGRAIGGRLAYGLGFTGHGLGSTRMAGEILAHMTLDRPTELLDLALVRKKPVPYPPEPLRRWAVSAVTHALRRVDAGERPGLLLRLLDRMGLGFSS
jgi:glycine/D-amino acid oxidase-like deaminating enzyme